MIPLAFHGGTALRFLFSHGRYSEDLDFALEGNREYYNFRDFLKAIRSDLSPEGYQIEIKANDQKRSIAHLFAFRVYFTRWGYLPCRVRSLR